MRRRRGSLGARLEAGLAVAFAAGLLACGGDDICLNCPNGTPTATPTVTVTGNIASSSPFTNPNQINVLICVGLEPGQDPASCPTSFLTVPSVEGTFSRTNVDPGALDVFFWVDENGSGMIEPDDPIAQLADPEGALDDVPSGRTVGIGNTRIQFLDGTATASISVTVTPTPTPSAAAATPTPTQTP
ncbi:MAG: hypothetical protein AB1689_28765 [Thermodesulfobacteriota bacterium]